MTASQSGLSRMQPFRNKLGCFITYCFVDTLDDVVRKFLARKRPNTRVQTGSYQDLRVADLRSRLKKQLLQIRHGQIVQSFRQQIAARHQ